MAVTVFSRQRKTNILRAHSQLGLEGKVFLVLCADIGTDLAIPALIRTLNGIGRRAGQVVNIINIGFAVGSFIGRFHRDGITVAPSKHHGSQAAAGQITTHIVIADDLYAVLLQVDLLADHIALKDNIPVAKLQLICAEDVTCGHYSAGRYRAGPLMNTIVPVAAAVCVNPHSIAYAIDAQCRCTQGQTNQIGLACSQCGAIQHHLCFQRNIFLIRIGHNADFVTTPVIPLRTKVGVSR